MIKVSWMKRVLLFCALILTSAQAAEEWSAANELAGIRAQLPALKAQIENEVIPRLNGKQKEQYERDLDKISGPGATLPVIKSGLNKLIGNLGVFGSAPDILTSAAKLKKQLDELPHRQLQVRAEVYFRQYFGDRFANIDFEDKRGGVQMGNIINVTLKDGTVHRYYAKTHRGGLKSGTQSSGTRAVDPKELLAYRVLARCGLAPETHFFYDDKSNFYIATEDAGENFQVYSKVKTRAPDLQPLNEELRVIPPVKSGAGKEKNQEAKWNLIEALLSRYESVTPWVNGLVSIDLVCRMLRLSDIINNDENFGFREDQVVVIDFEVLERGEYHELSLWEGFKKGNGEYLHGESTDLFTKYILSSRAPGARISKAAEVFETNLANLSDILRDTTDEVREVIKELDLDASEVENFDQYVEGVEKNIVFFKGKFLEEGHVPAAAPQLMAEEKAA